MSRVAQLERLLAAEPNDPFVLYGLANEYAKLGRVDEAVAFYDRCLAADPGYLYAYYHKGKTLGDADRTAEAVTTLKVGLEKAKAARDAKAANEIGGLLDSLE
jgi:tetratricopeptide (TPR) repeat protein